MNFVASISSVFGNVSVDEDMNRFKRTNADLESNSSSAAEAELVDVKNRNTELETLVGNFKQLLDVSRQREKKLVMALEANGGNISLDFDREDLFHDPYDEPVFVTAMCNRGCWLVGLLLFQSFSSYILSSNEDLLKSHPIIIYFLTMLVGAGGNAGNQATVRVIRAIALKKLQRGDTMRGYVLREFLMASALCFMVGGIGFLRVSYFSSNMVSLLETTAITIALMLIVFISIVVGALLPIAFHAIGLDPANSSTTIQVIMDISGVLITCLVAAIILDTEWGQQTLVNGLASAVATTTSSTTGIVGGKM
mmetsp:Transcript_18443/g.31006  ORF Transcript_18443/g.31006 Transcript_18443/m.31006 type:complete len:309 (+) Transcript_18443:172-1098(+)